MSKSKNKEVLDQLYNMVIKEAQAGGATGLPIKEPVVAPVTEVAKVAENPTASGVPGQDTNYQSVSKGTETTDKNSVGADKLKPQDYKQAPATTDSIPVAKTGEEEAAKVASETSATDVAKLGAEILQLVEKLAAKPTATGVPGKDTKYQSVSDSTNTVDKNSVGAEKLKPQEYSQKPATGPSIPVAKAAEAPSQEEVDKIASFEFGRQLAEAIFKQAQVNELELVKEAGRRDFEAIIAQAAAELEQNEKQASVQTTGNAVYNEKQAEDMGASMFQEMLKQAQYEYAVSELQKENQFLKEKYAQAEQDKLTFQKQAIDAIAAKEAAAAAKLAEEREVQKMAWLSESVTENVIKSLKAELLKSNA